MSDWDEIRNKLCGFGLPDATTQADHIVLQVLDGVRVGARNRDSLREYLIMHLLDAEKRGAVAYIKEKFKNYGCD